MGTDPSGKRRSCFCQFVYSIFVVATGQMPNYVAIVNCLALIVCSLRTVDFEQEVN